MTSPFPPNQVSEAELKTMTTQQIEEAFLTGRLKAVMAGQDPTEPAPWPAGQITEAELKQMSPAGVVEAYRNGRLNALLGKPVAGQG